MKLFNFLKNRLQNLLEVVVSSISYIRYIVLHCAVEKRGRCDDVTAYHLSSVVGYVGGHMLANSSEIENRINAGITTEAVDEKWKNSPSYPPPYIAALSNVTVIAGGRTIICDSILALNDEIETGFRKFNLQPKDFDTKISDGPIIHLRLGRLDNSFVPIGIHLFNEHEANYFHWIVEILPRLLITEQYIVDPAIPLLVSDGLHPNLYMFLELLKHPDRPICKLKRGERYQVRSLIYPSDISRVFDTYDRPPSTDTVYLPVGLLKKMVINIKDAHDESCVQQGRRLFLRRGSTYRRLLNEDEIIELLDRYSFEAIDLNSLTIYEQITLFSQAEIIVGPSGAGFANILWCSPKTRIFILHSDHPFKKYPYWDALGRVSGVSINYLAGPRANFVTDKFQAHDDYYIEPGEVVDRLNIM